MASYCFRPNSPQSIAKGMAVHRYYGDWAQVRYHCEPAIDGTLVLMMEEEDEVEINRLYLEICKLKGIDPDGYKPRKKTMGLTAFCIAYIVAAISFMVWQLKNLPMTDHEPDSTYVAMVAINGIMWFFAVPVFLFFWAMDRRAKRDVGKP